MKKIFIVLLACLLCLGFTSCNGCSDSTTEDTGRIVRVNTAQIGGDKITLYVDSETKVVYMFVDGGGYATGLVVMVDEHGNPLLWEGETK